MKPKSVDEPDMIFLKLGGSLITDKSKPETPRTEVIQRLAQEIAAARKEQPDLRLLIGHGSGSFGHPAAARYGTHLGASTREQWNGFVEVWAAAHRLHHHVMDALRAAGVPAISIPPSASAICEKGKIASLATRPLLQAVEAGLVPVTMGDAAFDRLQGATIISTEQVLAYIAPSLGPRCILLAGLEEGVYAQYPTRTQLLSEVVEAQMGQLPIGRSQATDVTGGMADKIRWALAMVKSDPNLKICIFSGMNPGNVQSALSGADLGTRIRASEEE